MNLTEIIGRYGMTTCQVLASACAVMEGAPAPPVSERVSVAIRGRLEAGDGSAAAQAFFRATEDPYGVISRAVYPVQKNDKTPEGVFRSWCALRGGPDIELRETSLYET